MPTDGLRCTVRGLKESTVLGKQEAKRKIHEGIAAVCREYGYAAVIEPHPDAPDEMCVMVTDPKHRGEELVDAEIAMLMRAIRRYFKGEKGGRIIRL